MASIKQSNSDMFLEIEDVLDANEVDLTSYTFVAFSESRNRYIFKKRQRKS